jgi:hypothetical protein
MLIWCFQNNDIEVTFIWFSSCCTDCVEILIPKVMVLQGGAFEVWLSYEDRTLMNVINTLMQKFPETCLSNPPCEETAKNLSHLWTKKQFPTGSWTDSMLSRTSSIHKCEKSVIWYFVVGPPKDLDTTPLSIRLYHGVDKGLFCFCLPSANNLLICVRLNLFAKKKKYLYNISCM